MEIMKKRSDRIRLDLQNDVLEKDKEIESYLTTIRRITNDKEEFATQLSRISQENAKLNDILAEKIAEIDHFEEEKENLLQIVQQLAQIGNPNLNFRSQSANKINSNNDNSINNINSSNDAQERGFEIPVMIKEDTTEEPLVITEESIKEDRETDSSDTILTEDPRQDSVRIARASLLEDLEKTMTNIWPEGVDAEDMEYSLLEAVRKERQDSGLNARLEADLEHELVDEEIMRSERGSKSPASIEDSSLVQIWEDGVEDEMETSLLEAVRKERQDSGLNARLEADLEHELVDEEIMRSERGSKSPASIEDSSLVQIWEDGVEDEMETSLLEAVRKERHSSGLNARLEADQIQIWEDGIGDAMETSLLEAVRKERHSSG